MPTIREVAEQAGVSFTTVSHVINNTRFVSEDTRARVLSAMKALNYRPNALARSLRSGKTHTLGLILPDSSNPFFAEMGRSIEEYAFQEGYSVILCNTEGDDRREQVYVDVLSKKLVDGVIFVAAGEQAESLQALMQQDLPVVVVDRDLGNVGVDAVLTDNRQGGYLATCHLIDLGHRRIACISGPSNLTPSAERITGYRSALEEAGLPFDPNLVVRGDFHPASGLQAVEKLLNLQDPPTALFACNDLMALGALQGLYRTGRRVPEDCSIVGFDDIELTCYTAPPITTIAQPKAEIGRLAAQLLIGRMNDKTRPPVREFLPTRLVVRDSTGPRRLA